MVIKILRLAKIFLGVPTMSEPIKRVFSDVGNICNQRITSFTLKCLNN